MIIIGLTGSMAMGKSSLVKQIQLNLGWSVWDADREVRSLYADSQLNQELCRLFPKAEKKGKIDKLELRKLIEKDDSVLEMLEEFLHPRLSVKRLEFIAEMSRLHQRVIVVDIPLLFETGWDEGCDITVLVTCPPWLQQQRIKMRGLSTAYVKQILKHQLPVEEKRQMADIIVESGLSKHHTWISFWQQIEPLIRGAE